MGGAKIEFSRLLVPHPLANSLHGLKENIHRKRFVEVSVNAQFLGIFLMANPFVGGNHNDPAGEFLFLSECLNHKKTATARHHHVDDDQIRVNSFGQNQPFGSVPGDVNLKINGSQRGSNRLGNRRIIVNNKCFHNSDFRQMFFSSAHDLVLATSSAWSPARRAWLIP